MQSTADTQYTVRLYTDAWIGGARDAALTLIAPGAEISWNLDQPVDDEHLVEIMNRIAIAARSVTVISCNCSDGRAALVYDCALTFGTVRMAEFLTVSDGRISAIRQLYDVVAVRQHLPELFD